MTSAIDQFDQNVKRFWERLRQTLTKNGFNVEVDPFLFLGSANKLGAITKVNGFRVQITPKSEVSAGHMTNRLRVTVSRFSPAGDRKQKVFASSAEGELNFKAISNHIAEVIQVEKREAAKDAETYDRHAKASRTRTIVLRKLQVRDLVTEQVHGEESLNLPEGHAVELPFDEETAIRIRGPLTELQLRALLETCKKIGLL